MLGHETTETAGLVEGAVAGTRHGPVVGVECPASFKVPAAPRVAVRILRVLALDNSVPGHGRSGDHGHDGQGVPELRQLSDDHFVPDAGPDLRLVVVLGHLQQMTHEWAALLEFHEGRVQQPGVGVGAVVPEVGLGVFWRRDLGVILIMEEVLLGKIDPWVCHHHVEVHVDASILVQSVVAPQVSQVRIGHLCLWVVAVGDEGLQELSRESIDRDLVAHVQKLLEHNCLAGEVSRRHHFH
mmetsp:Transcript_62580/g.135854  ORF Transcript_62580/g.135854 Transcript_62580/m.135854 type:complete len:240 (+) Transcript_62580:130-849(+)